jgi:hypothetical protein
MDFLAKSDVLGILETIEVYIQYNGPRLLSCKNQAGQVFVALWAEEDDDADLWLYMLVSLDRLESVRTGKISLHQAFSEPENGFLYELNYTHVDSEWQTKQVSAAEINQSYLPLADTFLACDPITFPQSGFMKSTHNKIERETVA